MSRNNKKCGAFESLQRVNYINQIAEFMATEVGNNVISTHYGNIADSLLKKSLIKVDPILKQQICKKCKIVLIPNYTAKVKVKSKKKIRHVIWKCKLCNHVTKYLGNQEKKLWSEKPEFLVELLSYSEIDKGKSNEHS